MRGLIFNQISVCLLMALAAGAALAQGQPPQPQQPAPQTRAEQIEQERRRKAAELQPDDPTKLEQKLNYIKDKEILQRLTEGVAGLRVRLGGLITGSGFAAGPEYYRRGLFHEKVHFRTSARASVKKFYLMDADLSAPNLANDHIFLDGYAAHFDYPRIDYYGPGPNSLESGRSDFLLEETWVQATAGVRPVKHVRMGVSGRYLLVNVSRGRDDRFVSTDQIFTEATTPGIQNQTNFLRSSAFIQYDWRDIPGGPRRGGNYLAEYSNYSDVERRHFSFNRLDLDAQQYIPFFNERRVIALRARVQAADAHAGNEVPFYLQPTLGGSDDLRGFRPFRFYDNSSLLLQAEYRWEVFSGLDMALFADAGRVFDDWHQINLRQLQKDYGFGFRFNVRNNVFLRIDLGFSHEGAEVWFKFSNIF